MENKIILKVPTEKDTSYILEYKRIWIENNPNTLMNGACGLDYFNDISDWFKKINRYANAPVEELEKDGKVKHLTYLALLNSKIIGMVGIRPFINKVLLENGSGNIGYGVLPTERSKGYATEILRQSLEILKSFGINRAVLGCYKENISSKKVIEKNGGICDKDWIDEEGKSCLRFYINL